MNILFVTSRPSAQNGKADQITTFKAKEYLINQGHDVDELTLTRCSIFGLAFFFIINALQFKIIPMQTLLYASHKNSKSLKKYIQKKDYEKVYFHLIRTTYFFDIVNKEKRYLGMQISQDLNFGRTNKKLKFGFKKMVYLVEEKLCAYYEKNIITQFKRVNVVGSADHKRLVKPDDERANVTVVPHGVDVPDIEENPRDSDLIFLANFSSEPNRLSLQYLLSEVFPIICYLRPNTTLTIAGRNLPKKLFTEKMDSVCVIGEVADAHKLISQHKVFINPVAASAGMQNKVLTALAARTPVITTEEAVEGMDMSMFRSVITCPFDSARLAKTAVQLLNSGRVASISDDDYKAVCEHWSWQNLHKKWSKRFLEID